MGKPGKTIGGSGRSAHDMAAGPGGGSLLIVEPEALLRWSLVAYLGKWFTVFSADSKTAADRILDDQPIDALVVSEDLTDHGADHIEAHARERKASVRVVRVVMTLSGANAGPPLPACIEKPFELSELAKMLGIQDAALCLTPGTNECPARRV